MRHYDRDYMIESPRNTEDNGINTAKSAWQTEEKKEEVNSELAF